MGSIYEDPEHERAVALGRLGMSPEGKIRDAFFLCRGKGVVDPGKFFDEALRCLSWDEIDEFFYGENGVVKETGSGVFDMFVFKEKMMAHGMRRRNDVRERFSTLDVS